MLKLLGKDLLSQEAKTIYLTNQELVKVIKP
jgi:hypothetical protein